jgi:hypothetical protein
MAVILKPKRSESASSTPTTSDLAVGEIAINTADQKLYIRDSSDNIKAIGGGLNVTDTDTTVSGASAIQFSDTSTALMQITDGGSGTASVTVTINADQDYGLITQSVGVGNNLDYGSLS